MNFLEHVDLHHQESRNALLERMPVFQIRRLTGFAMLIKPTFEHDDAFIPRVEIDHDHRPNNETKQGCTGHGITNHLFASSGRQQLP